jgi:hypothetical protein
MPVDSEVEDTTKRPPVPCYRKSEEIQKLPEQERKMKCGTGG